MAERRPVRTGAERDGRHDQPELTAAEAGQYGMEQIAELTGRQPEGVTRVEPTEDGWAVNVEVLQDQRVPSSSDMLSEYETVISLDGELLSYRRLRQYPRGRGDTGKGS